VKGSREARAEDNKGRCDGEGRKASRRISKGKEGDAIRRLDIHHCSLIVSAIS
jgi:hypothetical protein